MIYDAIVVGSGPGGAIAATVFASRGKSVLLVDRQAFPRDKVCGDGMPARVMAMLKHFDIDVRKAGLDYHQIKGLMIKAPSGKSLTTYERASDNFSLASPRFSFDRMLHEHAVKVGAKFEVMDVQGPLMAPSPQGERVAGIIQRKGKTTIEHEARVVIAADGASSAIARALRGRVSDTEDTAVAIRAYARLNKPVESLVFFDFYTSLLPGYGWLFPVGKDCVNIGLGIFDQRHYKRLGLSLKELLKQFEERLRPEYDFEIDPATIKSWPLPLWKDNESRVMKGAFLVGDAGRFIDPLTGGGIYPAMVTGQFAAIHAMRAMEGVESAYGDYDTDWQQKIGHGLRKADLVQSYIASKPLVFNGIFAVAEIAPSIKGKLLSALAGEHT
jgi:menaquinone-9 beta-reductase